MCVQRGGGVLAQRGGALQRVGRGNGASHGLQAVDAVGVASQRVHAGQALERQGQGQQAFHIAPAAPWGWHGLPWGGCAQGDGAFAAAQQHAVQRRRGLGGVAGHAGQHRAHVAGFALQCVAEQRGLDARLARHLGGCLQGQVGRGNDVGGDGAQPGVAGLDALAGGSVQCGRYGGRQRNAVALQDGQGLCTGGRVGHGGARRHVQWVVARHVGHHQVDHARGAARQRQPPALDGRQVAPHAVHLANAGAAAQQGLVERLLVGQRDARQRQGQQRRAATRPQADHQIVCRETFHRFQHLLRGCQARRIGHRVGGFQHADVLTGGSMSIPRDHHAR